MKKLKLYSMTAKDNLNLETKGLQCITFVPLPSIVKGCILRGGVLNALHKETFSYPSERLRYDLSEAVVYTEWYRIFLDDLWRLDYHQNDEQHEDSHQCPDHTEHT